MKMMTFDESQQRQISKYKECIFQNFLRDLLQEARKSHEVTEDTLIEYTDTILQVFDSNKDGKLQLSEMAKYVSFLTLQNFLLFFQVEGNH